MKDRGWTYFPQDQADTAPPDYDEFTGAVVAYGVMDNYERQESRVVQEAPVVDLNQEYVDTLTESESNQYYVDLLGPQLPAEGSIDGGASGSGAELSCTEVADEATRSSQPELDSATIDRIEEIRDSAELDPDVKDARRKWMICMRANQTGRSFESRDQIVDFLIFRSFELQGLVLVARQESEGATSGVWRTLSDSAGQTWDLVGSPTPVGADEVRSLRSLELALFDLDVACGKSSGLELAMAAAERAANDRILDEFPELGGG